MQSENVVEGLETIEGPVKSSAFPLFLFKSLVCNERSEGVGGQGEKEGDDRFEV